MTCMPMYNDDLVFCLTLPLYSDDLVLVISAVAWPPDCRVCGAEHIS